MAIKKVAVIGAGVMGSGIAAQLANAGFDVEMLDRVDEKRFPADRNGVAQFALNAMLKTSPAPFMHKRNAKKIRVGNTDDNMDRISDCDLIIEVVYEDPKVKHDIFKKIDAHRKEGSIVASNTSTIPLHNLVEGQSEQFKKDFVITHFFNPPRYMPLLELITSKDNDPKVVKELTTFMDVNMGKGVVHCHDTPGFIANRIGTFWLQTAINEAHNKKMTIEEADAIIGRPMGIPKTGVFGLIDLVGLDLMPKISASLISKLPASDGYVVTNKTYPIIDKMIADGYTGRKGKGGFYRVGEKKEDGTRDKLSVDLETGAVRPTTDKVKLQAVTNSKKGGLKGLIETKDKGGDYAWSVLKQTLCYAAEHAHDIAGDITAIDTAMKLGYNWKFGPFELIDKMGVDYFIKRLEADGEKVPALLKTAKGKTFYRTEAGKLQFMQKDGSYANVVRAEGVVLLSDIKRASKPVASNATAISLPGMGKVELGARLWDIGDGVLCLEFASTGNSLEFKSMAMINKAMDMIEASQKKGDGKWKAMVIHNEGDNFSVGANLKMAEIAMKLKQNWVIEKLVKSGQDTMKRMKYAGFPIVSAPSGMALGGGCEVLMHSNHVQAHAETYTGLVEFGVGLLPAWGGSTELLTRAAQNKRMPGGPMPPVANVFETISTAKVATSAAEAKEMMILRQTDSVTFNKQRLLSDAKAKALDMINGFKPEVAVDIRLPGPSGKTALDLAVDGFYAKGALTSYDVIVAGEIAKVLTGGDKAGPGTIMTQDALRDLERKHFMVLAKDTRTQYRIQTTVGGKGRKEYEPVERKAGKPATSQLRAPEKRSLFGKVFGGKSAKASFGAACDSKACNDDKKIKKDTKPPVNWPKSS